MTCFPHGDRIIVDDEVIGRILEHLRRSKVADPPLPPRRAPPLGAAGFLD